MRVLILSANTGGGHNSAAHAMQECFENAGWHCDIRDGLSYMPPMYNEILCRGHIFCYRRLPKFYGRGYRLAEKRARHTPYQQTLRKEMDERPLPRRLLKLKALLEDYDALICAHVFVAHQVSLLRMRGEIHIPCYFLATDYTCSPGVNQLDMTGWLVPHPRLIAEFAASGIPENRIFPTGIPISAAFMRSKNVQKARRTLKLPEDRPIALLTCGSMGAGHMGRMVLALVEAIPKNALLIVVCGSNGGLEKRLKKLVRSRKLMVIGFTPHMHDYMQAADIFITKPGGLSTTEGVFSRTPLVLINAVPGVETRNMEFMKAAGCAVSVGGALSLARTVSLILRSGASMESLRHNCEREFTTNAAEEIMHIISAECGVEC